MCIWYLCVCAYMHLCDCVSIYAWCVHVFYFSNQTRLSWFEGSIENLCVIRCHDVMLRRPKKTQLLLKTEMFFFVFAMVFTWVSQGERNKNKDLRLFLWVVCRQLISSSGELSPHVSCIFLLFRFYKGAEFLLSYMGNIFWHYNSDAEKSMDYLPTLRWAMKTGPLKTLIVFWY